MKEKKGVSVTNNKNNNNNSNNVLSLTTVQGRVTVEGKQKTHQ